MKTIKVIALIIVSNLLNAQNPIPNAGFENWTSIGPFGAYEEPDNWGTLNSATSIISIYTVIKATGADVYTGNAAIKLKTEYISFVDQIAPAICVSGSINTTSQTISGGFPLTTRPTHLVGWYKYAPQNGDTCSVELTIWKRNGPTVVNIGEAEFNTTSNVGLYSRFTADITYFTSDVPDSARILLLASSPDDPQVNSTLFIDDLKFLDCNSLHIAKSITDVSIAGGNDGAIDITASGSTPPYSYAWSNGENTEDITNLTAGTYIVTVSSFDGCVVIDTTVVKEPTCITQNIFINSGWNLISSYIIPDDPSITAIFNSINADIQLVKDKSGNAFIPAFGINSIGNWQVERGYKVKAITNTTLTLGCTQADPATTPITIPAGWCIISYLHTSPMDAITALSSISSCVLIVKDNTGASYIPAFNINNIGDMQPGQGYKIKMSCEQTLNYPP